MNARPRLEPLAGATAAVHLGATALLTGFMAVVQWSLVPAQNRLDAAAYTVLEQGMNRVLERLTPALMITALLSGAARTALGGPGGRRVRALYAASTTGIGSMIVATLRVNAPINADIDTWDPTSPPADWRSARDRWERGHAFRARIGLIALGCAIAAAVQPH